MSSTSSSASASSSISPTVSPGDQNVGGFAVSRSANYFFGFLITFFAIMVLITVLGIVARRRVILSRRAGLYSYDNFFGKTALAEAVVPVLWETRLGPGSEIETWDKLQVGYGVRVMRGEMLMWRCSRSRCRTRRLRRRSLNQDCHLPFLRGGSESMSDTWPISRLTHIRAILMPTTTAQTWTKLRRRRFRSGWISLS